jgi:predicted Fe-Mo cluster-binding NifX family protein
MKIALSTDATDLGGDLNPNFGRCRRFLIYDAISGVTESVENPGYGAAGGAGVQAARALVDRGVKRLITGRVGPNSRPLLDQAGIEIIENRSGHLQALITSVADALPAAASNPVSASRPAKAGCCFCERCGYCSDGDAGLPCFQQRCPNCGAALERKFGKMN